MLQVFAWIEQTPLSLWVRESLWAFPAVLILHAFGMAFLVGGGVAIALRVLGVARGAPVAAFRRFWPAMWAGFWVALVSGVLLLAAYPAKALTNPVFALKFVCLGAALWLAWIALRRAEADGGAMARGAAAASLAMWAAAIFAGRFLAYTHTHLMVS